MLAQTLTLIAQFGDGITPPSETFELDAAEGTNSLTNLELLISRVIGFLTVVAGLFFIIYFVMGAFKWVTAGGDSGKVQKARDQMIQGVLGLVLIVSAYAIIGVIGTVLGLNILQPAEVIQSTLL